MHPLGFFATEATGKPGLGQSKSSIHRTLSWSDQDTGIRMNTRQLLLVFLPLCSRFRFQKGSNPLAQRASLVLLTVSRKESL